MMWSDSEAGFIRQQTIGQTASSSVPIENFSSLGLELNDGHLYVGGRGAINKINLATKQNIRIPVSTQGVVGDLAISQGFLYWSDIIHNTISKASLTAPEQQAVIYRLAAGRSAMVRGIALSPDGSKVFVTIRGHPLSVPSRHMPQSQIIVMNADGTNVTEVRRGWVPGDAEDYTKAPWVARPGAIVVDQTHVYYVDHEHRQIRRFTLSQPSVTEIYGAEDAGGWVWPTDMKIENNMLFASGMPWSNAWRTSPGGFLTHCLTSFTDVSSACDSVENTAGRPYLRAVGFTMDAQYFYYTLPEGGAFRVSRSTLSATPEEFLAISSHVNYSSSTMRGVATDRVLGKTFFGTSAGLVQYDHATKRQMLIAPGTGLIQDVEFDRSSGFVYFSEYGSNRIRRCGIDGQDLTDLLAGLSSKPVGLAIDSVSRKIYWTDEHATSNVMRAELDGTGVERLTWNTAPTGTNPLANIRDIDFDQTTQRFLTFAGGDENAISIVDAAGVVVSVVVKTGFTAMAGIGYDSTAQRVYYPTMQGIHSVKLDGSDVQTVFAGGGFHRYVTVSN
jgi:DNA-binding beta-propeller fold protein YncE